MLMESAASAVPREAIWIWKEYEIVGGLGPEVGMIAEELGAESGLARIMCDMLLLDLVKQFRL